MADSSVVGALRVLLTADSAQFETAMKSASASITRLSKDFGNIGRQLQDVGGLLTKTITVPLVGLGAGAAKLAIDFESSFAGVRKTVNASEAEFQQMAQAFRDLSKTIPVNVNELNRLGEAAGALGIPKAQVVDFARVMSLLGVTTNVTADQAAESIAKIQNIFGAAGQDTERFASTLVALGNDGASTEAQILDMATRIAGAGNVIGLTQGQVLGFASALSSVGLEAEAGGTAISRVFVDMASAVSKGGEKLNQFAQVAGMSADQFAEKFKTDAAGAVTAFIEGLGRIKSSGGDLIGTLAEMDIKEVRLRDTLLRAAGAGDLLRHSLETQATAWDQNSALTAEANKRFETTEAQMTLLWNRIKDVGITLGNSLLPAIKALITAAGDLLPLIDGLAKAFGTLPGWVQASAIGFVGLSAAVGPVIYAFGKVFEGASTLIGVFGKKGIALRALTASYEAVGKVSAMVGGLWGTTVLAATVALAGAIDQLAKATEDGADAFKRGEVSGQNFADSLGDAFARGTNPVRAFLHDLAEAYKVWSTLVESIMGTPTKLPPLPAAPKAHTTEAATVPGLPKDLKEIEATLNAGVTPAIQKTTKSVEEFRAQLQGLSENELAGLKTDLDSGAFSMKELAAKYGISTNAIKLLKGELKDGEQAHRNAAKAAKELGDEQERLISVLERTGVVTDAVVSKKIGEFVEILNAAARQGAPALAQALAALAPDVAAFAEAMRRAGYDSQVLLDIWNGFTQKAGTTAEAMQAWERSLPIVPIADLTDRLKALGLDTDISRTKTERLEEAYHSFGGKTRAELEELARVAKENYALIAASVGKNAPEARKAYLEMIEAQRAATGQLPSVWETDVLPRIRNVVATISGSVSDAFASILVGANGFKDAFVNVWHSIQRSIADVLSAILNDFIGRFLKGLLGAMSGAQGGFAGAFAGMLGGGGGGGMGSILTNGGGIFGGMLGGGGGTAIGADLGGEVGAAGGGGLMGLGTLGTAGVIAGVAAAAYGLYSWYQRKQANIKSNDSRDAFTAQFGGSGTGEGSGFMNLAAKLTEATGEAGGGRLFDQFLNARKPEEVARAIEQINAALDAYAQKSGAATDSEAAHADAIAKTTAELDVKTQAITAQMKTLDDELAKLDASEAPEEHMGVVEKQTRERIEREKADLQRQLDDAKTAAAAAIDAIKASGTAASDQLKTQGATVIDDLGAGFVRLAGLSQEQIDKIKAMLADLGKHSVTIPVHYEYPDAPRPPSGGGGEYPTAAHATGWVGSTPHVAMIAEGGQAEMVGPVSFMSQALEGALARVGMPAMQSVTIMEIDKREIGRAIADVLPGELRRLGVRVRA